MKRPLKLMFGLTFALLCLYVSASHARLSPAADSLLQNFRIEPCCATTIDKCVSQKPSCAVAPRLAAFLQWLDSMEVPGDRMAQSLQTRYESFIDTKKHNLDLGGWPVIGEPNSPITAVMYYSSTCPACKTNFREILPEVTTGRLRGKAKIVVKPFGNNIGNLALVAAHDMGRFVDFMLAMAQVGSRVDEELIYDIADAMLFDRDVFRTLVTSEGVMKRAEASSKEAGDNGATHVPTYFIAGRRYNSVLIARWIADAMEFVHETELRRSFQLGNLAQP